MHTSEPEILDPVVAPHVSKIAANDPRLRLSRPRPRGLKKAPAIAMAAIVAIVVTIAVVSSLGAPSPVSKETTSADEQPAAAAEAASLPANIRNAPDNSDPVGLALRDPAVPGSPGKPLHQVGGAMPGGEPSAAPAAEGPSADDQAALERQTRAQELAKALAAGTAVGNVSGTDLSSSPPMIGPPGSGVGPASAGRPGTPGAPKEDDANLQRRKEQFIATAAEAAGGYLAQRLQRPVSPYEVKAGSIIPAVLLTGLNSDLPGQVVAQVRQNVFDTVSGNHLLIPQGSRLLAVYDSMTAFGQNRILVCWSRLIRPDGSSINLECMPGVDSAGAAGFADQVDHHWGRIVTGVVLSSLLAATAQRSQGDVSGLQPTFPQMWASNTAGTINQVGQDLTRKNLAIQPTIRVRPGFTVNVLVSRDIVLSPYNQVK